MDQLLEPIILHYGKKQITQAIEDFSELTKELCKNIKGKDSQEQIKEEMADCYVMLEQLKHIYQFRDDEIKKIMFDKLKRTLNIVNEEVIQKIKRESN